ncbi:hypothetical protein PTKIN_Ptkin11bG0174400 [Pterospermum kingtungense]
MKRMMIRNNIIVTFVKEKETQITGIIIVQLVIILLTANVLLENIHLSTTRSFGVIEITSTITISALSTRSMATNIALSVVGLVKMKPSSVLHATILSTTNVRKKKM